MRRRDGASERTDLGHGDHRAGLRIAEVGQDGVEDAVAVGREALVDDAAGGAEVEAGEQRPGAGVAG